MRIIAGSFRGKKLIKPEDLKTRPLKDLVKESIFNIIYHSNKFKINLLNSHVLDLFSGVGSFGIECLSRGVKEVVFIENYEKVLSILKKNLGSLKLINNYKILAKDIYKQNTLPLLSSKFDLIFLDPPFKDKNLEIIFNYIIKYNLLKKNGVIVLHRNKNEPKQNFEGLSIIDKKIYGLSEIFFFTRSN
tara:strand:- start:910 stop:1476 length:567 start_codon:yes stop_codon:yes gene_type:complete